MFNMRRRASVAVRLESLRCQDIAWDAPARLSPPQLVTFSPREELLPPLPQFNVCARRNIVEREGGESEKKSWIKRTWYYCVFKFDPLLNPTEIWCVTHEWLCARGFILTYKWNSSSVNITRVKAYNGVVGSSFCRKRMKSWTSEIAGLGCKGWNIN